MPLTPAAPPPPLLNAGVLLPRGVLRVADSSFTGIDGLQALTGALQPAHTTIEPAAAASALFPGLSEAIVRACADVARLEPSGATGGPVQLFFEACEGAEAAGALVAGRRQQQRGRARDGGREAVTVVW